MFPLMRAPVEKLTEPREWPGGATIPWYCINRDPFEVMPADEIEIVPNLLTRSIPLAKADIGKANASSAKITTRLISSSQNLSWCCLFLSLVIPPEYRTAGV